MLHAPLQAFCERALDAMAAVGVIDYEAERGDELKKISDAQVRPGSSLGFSV